MYVIKYFLMGLYCSYSSAVSFNYYGGLENNLRTCLADKLLVTPAVNRLPRTVHPVSLFVDSDTGWFLVC